MTCLKQLEHIQIVIRKDRKKRTLERLRYKKEDDITKLKVLRKYTAIVYTTFFCSGRDDMVGSYENNKVPSRTVKGGGFLEQLSDY
jgi:hypothetical protein